MFVGDMVYGGVLCRRVGVGVGVVTGSDQNHGGRVGHDLRVVVVI